MIVFTHRNPSTGKIFHVGLSKDAKKALTEAFKDEHWKHVAKWVGISQDILLETKDRDEAVNLVKTIIELEQSRRPNDKITVQL